MTPLLIIFGLIPLLALGASLPVLAQRAQSRLDGAVVGHNERASFLIERKRELEAIESEDGSDEFPGMWEKADVEE